MIWGHMFDGMENYPGITKLLLDSWQGVMTLEVESGILPKPTTNHCTVCGNSLFQIPRTIPLKELLVLYTIYIIFLNNYK